METVQAAIAAVAGGIGGGIIWDQVESLLAEWNYPNSGRVVFSEKAQDLVIGDQLRTSHGKGVRALTCGAFVLGLSEYCRRQRLPHPSMVALDSPLLAYREKESADEALRKAGVKEAFYLSLAAKGPGSQVIVFENHEPPLNLPRRVPWHHFGGADAAPGQRAGFFPV